MRKLQKAAVVAALVGCSGFIAAGPAFAGEGGGDIGVAQSTQCRSHDTNVDILGEVGIANGALGNVLGGEGNPGQQTTKQGSTMDCSNHAKF